MRYVTLLLLCVVAVPCRVEGQIGLSVDAHQFTVGGVSRDTSAANSGESFKPFRPILVAVRPEWSFGRVRVGLGIAYGTPDIADDGDPLAVVLHNTAKVLEFAPEVSYRLAELPRGLIVRIHGGPLIDSWKLDGEDAARTRAGGLVALSTEFPVFAKLHGVVRLSGALTAGLFERSDLPPEFRLQAMRRLGIGLGLRYGP